MVFRYAEEVLPPWIAEPLELDVSNRLLTYASSQKLKGFSIDARPRAWGAQAAGFGFTFSRGEGDDLRSLATKVGRFLQATGHYSFE